MKLYTSLTLSNEKFADIISNSTPETFHLNRTPHATREDLLTFTKLAYDKENLLSKTPKDVVLPPGWTLLTCGYSKWNDYFGIVLWCPSRLHAVIAHRGTVVGRTLGAFVADFKAIYNSSTSSSHLITAITFVERVAKVLREINTEEGNQSRQLSITGHSLGGFLAAVTTFTAEYLESDTKSNELVRAVKDHGLHPHAVTFDSPGSGEMMRQLRDAFDDRCSHTMLTKTLDITTYVIQENLVNTVNDHIGTVVLLTYNNEATADPPSTFNIKTHYLTNFSFQNIKEELIVKSWPKGVVEKAWSAWSQHNPKATVPYKRNVIDQRIFSPREIQILEIWKNFKNFDINLNTSDFFFLKMKENMSVNELLERFQMEKGSIECDTEEKLECLIGRTKQLVRWFYEDIMEGLKKAMGKLPAALYHFLSNVYQQSMVTISLTCEDTLGLKDFMDSDFLVLGLEVEDHTFEAGRLQNLFKRMGKFCTFMTWKNLIVDLDENVDIENLHNNDHFTHDNLLIIDCVSLTDKTHTKSFKAVITKMQTNKNKKSIFLYLKNSFVPKLLFACYNIASIMKISRNFQLKDLTRESLNELLKREVIVFGDGRLSLQKLLQSIDIDSLQWVIGRDLKKLLSDKNYLITIESSLPEATESDELFSRLDEEVAESDMIRLLKKDVLVVVSGDTAPWVERNVILAAGDGSSILRRECRLNPDRAGYWLEASRESLCLKEIYHDRLHLTRKFHSRIKVDVEKLIQQKNIDTFVIENINNKKSLASALRLSSESEKLLNRNISYSVVRSLDDIQLDDFQGCVHRLRVENLESGESQLMWQSSSRSLERLRPFIAPDYSQAVDERELIQSNRRLIIITGEPGMGKTTFLKNIFRFVEPEQWTIRVNCINFQNEISNLPIPMDMESATMFLTVQSCAGNSVERRLLQHSLKPDSLRPVLLLIDGFDEIRSLGADAPEKRVIELIKFMLHYTSARVIITTRMNAKNSLENALLEFATIFQQVQKEGQMMFLETFWSTYLQVSIQKFGDLERERLRQQALLLYEGSGGLPRQDASQFLGIPQQMKMLARVYLKPIVQFFNTSELILQTVEIESTLDLYKTFINSKLDIYFNYKTESIIKEYDRKDIIYTKIIQHQLLAMNMFLPEFVKKHMKQVRHVNRERLIDLNRYGIIHLLEDGTYQFVHHTYAEYFLADLLIQWLQQEDSAYEHIPLEGMFLSIILLYPEYQVIRMFIDEYYTKNSLSQDACKAIREKLTSLLQKEGMEKFCDKNYQTALHIAVAENKKGIMSLFLNLRNRSTSLHTSYISFIAAWDIEARTALMLSHETKNRELLKGIILQFINKCSIESKRKILMATFLRFKRITEVGQTFLSDISKSPHLSFETKSVCLRIKEIFNTELDVFITTINKSTQNEIIDKYNQIDDANERYYLPLAANDKLEIGFTVAAMKGYKDVLELFFNEDVVKISNDLGWTPLHYTILGEYETVEYLVNKKFNINSITRNGLTPLLMAVQCGKQKAVEYLLENGANPNHAASVISIAGGETALMIAINIKHIHIVKNLLAKGADPNFSDSNGDTPLLAAVRKGDEDIVKHLLLNAANPNCSNSKGETSISLANSNGHKTISNNLIAYGAKENEIEKMKIGLQQKYKKKYFIDNVAKQTPLSFGYQLNITENGDSKTVNIETPFLTAAYDGNMEQIKIFVEGGEDCNYSDSDGFTPLIVASQNGHKEIVKFLHDKGANIDCFDTSRNTALLLAALNGHTRVVEYLIENDADCNFINFDGFSPLLVASHNGHQNVVELLCEKGVNLECSDFNGNTALYVAALNGHISVVKYLVEKGADCSHLNFDGFIPLFIASYNGHVEVFEFLNMKYADHNSRYADSNAPLVTAVFNGHINMVKYLIEKGTGNYFNSVGITLLSVASQRGHKNVVEFLFDKGTDLNSSDLDGNTPLFYATKNGHTSVVKYLVESGANCNQFNTNGLTPLSIASQNGYKEIVEYLYKNGADLNYTTLDGSTALLYAAHNGHTSVVKFLLENGADCNHLNANGFTPLLVASQNGHKVVKILDEKGADLNCTTSDGNTAILLAAHKGNINVVQYLVEKGVDYNYSNPIGLTPLLVASQNGHKDVIEFLHKKGVDLNSTNTHGNTALSFSALNGYTSVMKYLIENGVDYNQLNSNRLTPLLLASQKGHEEVIEFLFEKGADLNSTSSNGKSALLLASENNHINLVKYLIEKGADVNLSDNQNSTPLLQSAEKGHARLVVYLVNNGADITCTNDDGNNPLLCGARGGNVEIVQYILEKGVDISAKNKNGRTALLEAAVKGHIGVVMVLLERGADKSCRDVTNMTALEYALEGGYKDIVSALFDEDEDEECSVTDDDNYNQ